MMPKVINRATGMSIGRGIPSSIAQRSNPPQQKSPCQKYGSESLACKEYELSQLRSSSPVTRQSAEVPVDPQIAFGGGVLNIIGVQTHALEQQIKKNVII